MKKNKVVSSLLAASMILSAVPAEALAQESEGINNNEINACSTDNGGVNDVELYLSKTGETDTSISVSWTPVENASSYSIVVNN